MTAKGFMTKTAAVLLIAYAGGVHYAQEHYTGTQQRENDRLRDSLVANFYDMRSVVKALKTAREECVPGLNNEQRELYVAKDSLETMMKTNDDFMDKEKWKKFKSWYYLFE